MTNHIGLDELAIQEGIRKPWETLLMMTKTPYGLYAFTHKDLERFAALVAAAEREACAKVADDRLIAAAPDLLEVLKAFSDYVRDEQMATDGAVTYSTTTINHWAFLARAAIAKATGGEQ